MAKAGRVAEGHPDGVNMKCPFAKEKCPLFQCPPFALIPYSHPWYEGYLVPFDWLANVMQGTAITYQWSMLSSKVARMTLESAVCLKSNEASLVF